MSDFGYQEFCDKSFTAAEAPIFDSDDWQERVEGEQQGDISTDVALIDSKKQIENEETIKKLDLEIKQSKENFFKKNGLHPVINSQRPKHLPSIKQNPSSILKEGYIEKKTDGKLFKWHRRYMVLTGERIYFFTDESRGKMSGCINLKLLGVSIRQQKQRLTIDMDGQADNIILKIASKTDRTEWKEWLEKAANYHRNEHKFKIKTAAKQFYCEKDLISEREFLKEAQTGDILLFYTNNTGANLQRFFTNSDFDHVAMVVRINGEPMVFESNPSYGVCLFGWHEFLLYFNLYQRITLRKLNFIRKYEAQQSLIEFAKRNLGRKYEIGALKMLSLESDFNWDKLKEEQEKKEARGYFCSELIAKAYKSVGLIQSKKSSARYWPVDFSEKSGLVLKKCAWLGPQINILLRKHIKLSF